MVLLIVVYGDIIFTSTRVDQVISDILVVEVPKIWLRGGAIGERKKRFRWDVAVFGDTLRVVV